MSCAHCCEAMPSAEQHAAGTLLGGHAVPHFLLDTEQEELLGHISPDGPPHDGLHRVRASVLKAYPSHKHRSMTHDDLHALDSLGGAQFIHYNLWVGQG